jgi:hypothetical protein
MSITNDEVIDSVRDAMTYIDTWKGSVLPYDIKEARDLVLRLRGTIEWIEIHVDGDWQDEGTAEVD